MKQSLFVVTGQKRLNETVYEMRLSGDTGDITRPGQFVNLKIRECFLRRPISVCDAKDGTLTLVYRVVGKGTGYMSRMEPGEQIDILTGLGNGYDLSKAGEKPLLIGGGVGVPPLYMLCRELIRAGARPEVILGFNNLSDMFYKKEFEDLGAHVTVTTVDGSYGVRGFVTDAMTDLAYTYFYTCGPEPMLRAVYKVSSTSGQFSFEERMGCGFGACMGCTCRTITGHKRICREGPVLEKEEILW